MGYKNSLNEFSMIESRFSMNRDSIWIIQTAHGDSFTWQFLSLCKQTFCRFWARVS